MEKYFKIGDYFGGDVSVSSGTRERIVSAKGEVLATTPSPQVAKLTAHAINSHDELVAINKEFLDALESLDDCYSETSREELSRLELLRHKSVRTYVSDIIAKAKAAS